MVQKKSKETAKTWAEIEKIKSVIRANPQMVRSMALTPQVIEVLESVRGGAKTSSQIVAAHGITIFHANVLLKKLMDKEYITRAKKSHVSGGKEWVYTAIT